LTIFILQANAASTQSAHDSCGSLYLFVSDTYPGTLTFYVGEAWREWL